MKRPAAALLGCIAVLLLIAVAGVATIPTVPTGTWQPMGSMAVARSGAASVLLQDHRVLITGGNNGTDAVNSAEVFNTDGSFANVSAMGTPRSEHVAVALQDGRAMVAGGVTAGAGATNSVEIYDPSSDTWTVIAGGMVEARSKATASLLQDGRVLIAGGQNGNAPSSTVEIFDPNTGQFSFVGSLSSPRMGLASASLADGRVLIAGGSNGSVPVATSDVFDPTTNTVSAGPAMTSPRVGHSATSLLDGRVLIAGGNNGSADLASAEIFDPAVAGFAAVASDLAAPRRDHTAILLPNNNAVLIVGGTSTGNEVGTAEMVVPWTGAFATTGAPSMSRQQAAVSALQQDGLLVMAGGSSAGTPVSSAELYGFATVKTDAADYAPGSVVTITGAGWQPGETVTLTLVESPYYDTHPVMTAVADGQGNITNSDFIPDEHDLNIRFYLTAVGSQSGYQAQNTFTDANNDSNTLAISCASSSLVVGNTTTCTATETDTAPTPNNGSPLGTIAWSISPAAEGTFSPTPCTLVAVSSTVTSTCSTTFTGKNVGSGTISANYSRTNNNWSNSTTSTNFSMTVSNASTNTTVTSGTNPSVFGQSVTFTANVTVVAPGAGTPTGNVTFKDGATTLGTGALNGSGVATFSTSALNVATHSITAVYNGDSNFNTSTSSAISQLVNQAGTATSLTSSVNPSSIGQSVTFTATVTASGSGSGTPSGTVTFKDGATTLGTGTLNGSGVATFATSALALGSHSITAVYGGDTNFTGSTSSILTQIVNQATTTTTVASSANPSMFGQSVTFTATVAGSGSGTPTGTVTFKDGGTTLGTGTLSSGQATFSTSTLSVATHSITAVYGGDSNFTGSTSSAFFQVVNQANTSTAVTSSPNPSVFGQTVNFTVTVTAVAPGVGTPTGTVQVKMGNIVLGSGTLSGGQAIIAVSSGLSVGTNGGIKAFYNGDTNFAASQTQNATQQTVNQASTTTSVVSSGSPSNYGQSVTLTATVAVVAPGAGTPTGTVNFYDGGTCAVPGASLGSGVLSGTTLFQASASTATLDAAHSPHTVLACYGGDTNFLSSNGSFSQTVNKKSVTASITADDKDYDGTNAATIHCTLSGVLVADTANVTCNGTGTFADANADTGKTVTSNNLALSGSLSGNYMLSSSTATTTATIRKVDPTISVNPYSVTYNAASHTATGTATGIGGVDISSYLNLSGTTHTNAGDYPTDSWAFTGAQNYNDKSGTVHDHIDKATPTVTVTDPTPTYDATPHSATATATGIGGANVGGSFAFTYDGSGTTPANAKTSYAVVASFTSTDPNYNDAVGNGLLTILKADSATVVSVAGGESFTYDGNAHPASVSVTGAGGLNLSPAPVYSCGHTPLHVADSGCTASYSFAGDGNHNGSSDSKTYTITKAPSTTTVSGGGSFVFDGAAHAATVTVTGAGNLSLTPVPNYSCGAAPVHVADTPCTASYTFAGDGDHDGSNGSAVITITKAPSTTTVSGGGSFVFDGAAHAATVTVTGAGNLSLTPVPNYSCGAAPVHVADTPCTASYTFTGDGDHDGSNGSAAITITKAPSTTTVSGGGSFVFDGAAHAATATVTGAGNLSLTPVPNYSCGAAPVHVADTPCTASYTFTGDGDHDGSNGSAVITITKAPSTTTITPSNLTVTYDGMAHGATALVTGVGGLSQSVPVNYSPGGAPTPVNAGTYAASANYPGDSDHLPSMASGSITINPAVPAFSNLSSPSIIVGTASTTISGVIKAGALVPPGSVTIKVNGVTQLATIVGNGSFSSTFNTAAFAVTAVRYPINFAYNDTVDNNFSPASGAGTFGVHYATGGVCGGDAGHIILQPINVDGSSVWKQGSTVPSKFRVCDANGNSIGAANVITGFVLYQINGGTIAQVDETVDNSTNDLGWRFDPTGQQWIFNLSTKTAPQNVANRTYWYRIDLNDGSHIFFNFGLK